MSDGDTEFGDFDPEDAWDDDDPLEHKLDVLERVVTAFRVLGQVPPERRRDALRLLVKVERIREDTAARIDAIRRGLEDGG